MTQSRPRGPWMNQNPDTAPRRRGRPPKGDKLDPKAGVGLSPQIGAQVREIKKEIEARIGFPITIADTVRHLVHFYRQHNN